MIQKATPQNSTNVRFLFRPSMVTAALKFAPILQKPVLSRLFLTPQKRTRSNQSPLGSRVGTVEVAGQRIKVRACGRGPTVILVHGWQGHSGHLATIGTRLVSEGFTVVSFDMKAHGETGGHMSTLNEFVEALMKVAELTGPVHAVVAHSLGATAAALAMDRGLDVRGAVLVAPMVSFDFALDEFSKLLHLDSELREVAAQGAEELVGMKRAQANLLTLQLKESVPISIFHDVDDTRTPYHFSEKIAEGWPQASLSTTEGYGHREILNSRRVGEETCDFLQSLPLRESSVLDLGVVPEFNF